MSVGRLIKFSFSLLLSIACFSDLRSQTIAPLQNRWLTVSVRRSDGSFELRVDGLHDPVLASRIGAEINHQWVLSTDFPEHTIKASTFQSPLGDGRQIEVFFRGAVGKPNLQYTLQLYNDRPFGNVQVEVDN